MIGIVSGSRDWPSDNNWFVTQKMIQHFGDRGVKPLIISGGARGVDTWADSEAIRLKWDHKVMKAEWRPDGIYNPFAGKARNIEMLEEGLRLAEELEREIQLLAFQWNNSNGTGHMIHEAHRRDVPFIRFTERDLVPDLAALDMGDIE